MNVGLVACGKSKRDSASPAKHLYTGELFVKASGYCAATYDRWYILSALHGVVSPDSVLEPYDVTLIGQSRSVRLAWAAGVREAIVGLGLGGETFWFHAGRRYSEFLSSGVDARFPLVGLGIGLQLRWYKERGF